MSEVRNGRSTGEDENVLLDYASKVHVGLRDTGTRINRTLVLQTTFSLALLALAGGLAPKPGAVSVAGLQLQLPLPALLSALSTCLACLLMYQVGLVYHEEKLLHIIEGIYLSLGFTHHSMEGRLAHPLETAGVVTTILSISIEKGKGLGLGYRASKAFVVLLFIGFPVTIQILVIYRIVEIRPIAWAVPPILALTLSLWLLRQYIRE